MSTNANDEQILTVEELCKKMKISRHTLGEAIRAGLPFIDCTGTAATRFRRRRFIWTDVLAWFRAENERKAR